jgi:glutathione S-transferase
MLTLYEYAASGNCYKIRLLLHQLGIPLHRIEIDILKRESRTPEFLAKNPNGRVPLLELEPGKFLAESNAILYYFAEGTAFLPEDRLERALVLSWMFFEQYSHEPNIATNRFLIAYMKAGPEYADTIAKKNKLGYAALGVMEKHLSTQDFFVANRYTIADIALFAYTHVADEGGFNLSTYPKILAWIARVQAQPLHIAITV